MRAYQSIVAQLSGLQASLVAVSPMEPDESLTMAEKQDLEFSVLSDVGNDVARQYGLVFALDEEIKRVYTDVFKISLPEYNGDDSWELPIPATYVIGQDGVIAYAFVDLDYTQRAEPADIVATLRTLR